VKNRGGGAGRRGDEHPGQLSVGRRSRTVGRRMVPPWRGDGILPYHLPNSRRGAWRSRPVRPA
jgi:hypothetical protein